MATLRVEGIHWKILDVAVAWQRRREVMRSKDIFIISAMSSSIPLYTLPTANWLSKHAIAQATRPPRSTRGHVIIKSNPFFFAVVGAGQLSMYMSSMVSLSILGVPRYTAGAQKSVGRSILSMAWLRIGYTHGLWPHYS